MVEFNQILEFLAGLLLAPIVVGLLSFGVSFIVNLVLLLMGIEPGLSIFVWIINIIALIVLIVAFIIRPAIGIGFLVTIIIFVCLDQFVFGSSIITDLKDLITGSAKT